MEWTFLRDQPCSALNINTETGLTADLVNEGEPAAKATTKQHSTCVEFGITAVGDD